MRQCLVRTKQRMKYGAFVSFTTVGLLFAGLAEAAPLETPQLTTADDGATLTLTVAGGAHASHFSMDAPARIIVDLDGASIDRPTRFPGDGAIAGLRAAQVKDHVTRVVIDLSAPAIVRAAAWGRNESGVATLTVRLAAAAPDVFRAATGKARSRIADFAADPAEPPAVAQSPGAIKADAPSSTAAVAPTVAAVKAISAGGGPAASVREASLAQPAVPTRSPARAGDAQVSDERAAASLAAMPPPAAARPRPLRIAGRLPVVVIDAGHGGVDPGAPSVLAGKTEKTVTLAIAKAIKAELDASGKVKAVLTRDTDVFIPLPERVAIARRQKADLFISIHADSISNPETRGATVYTLSERASDREAEKLAAKENRADMIAGINLPLQSNDVADILLSLMQRETMNYSSEFADHVISQMSDDMKFRNNLHRFAGFAVLKAADVPSVLLETGYMSNVTDSTFLFSDAGQKTVARGVRQAVEQYFARRIGAPVTASR